jgi:hypothetical protein
VARLEFGDDLAERVGARGVEHLNVGKTQDHDSNVGDCGELGQEPLRGAEEKCSVEAIGHDVLVQESLFVVGVDRHIDWRGKRRRRPRHVSQGEDRRDGDADFDSEDEIEGNRDRGGDHEHGGVAVRCAGERRGRCAPPPFAPR